MSPTSVNRPPRQRSTDVGEVGFEGVSGGILTQPRFVFHNNETCDF